MSRSIKNSNSRRSTRHRNGRSGRSRPAHEQGHIEALATGTRGNNLDELDLRVIALVEEATSIKRMIDSRASYHGSLAEDGTSSCASIESHDSLQNDNSFMITNIPSVTENSRSGHLRRHNNAQQQPYYNQRHHRHPSSSGRSVSGKSVASTRSSRNLQDAAIARIVADQAMVTERIADAEDEFHFHHHDKHDNDHMSVVTTDDILGDLTDYDHDIDYDECKSVRSSRSRSRSARRGRSRSTVNYRSSPVPNSRQSRNSQPRSSSVVPGQSITRLRSVDNGPIAGATTGDSAASRRRSRSASKCRSLSIASQQIMQHNVGSGLNKTHKTKAPADNETEQLFNAFMKNLSREEEMAHDSNVLSAASNLRAEVAAERLRRESEISEAAVIPKRRTKSDGNVHWSKESSIDPHQEHPPFNPSFDGFAMDNPILSRDESATSTFSKMKTKTTTKTSALTPKLKKPILKRFPSAPEANAFTEPLTPSRVHSIREVYVDENENVKTNNDAFEFDPFDTNDSIDMQKEPQSLIVSKKMTQKINIKSIANRLTGKKDDIAALFNLDVLNESTESSEPADGFDFNEQDQSKENPLAFKSITNIINKRKETTGPFSPLKSPKREKAKENRSKLKSVTNKIAKKKDLPVNPLFQSDSLTKLKTKRFEKSRVSKSTDPFETLPIETENKNYKTTRYEFTFSGTKNKSHVTKKKPRGNEGSPARDAIAPARVSSKSSTPFIPQISGSKHPGSRIISKIESNVGFGSWDAFEKEDTCDGGESDRSEEVMSEPSTHDDHSKDWETMFPDLALTDIFANNNADNTRDTSALTQDFSNESANFSLRDSIDSKDPFHVSKAPSYPNVASTSRKGKAKDSNTQASDWRGFRTAGNFESVTSGWENGTTMTTSDVTPVPSGARKKHVSSGNSSFSEDSPTAVTDFPPNGQQAWKNQRGLPQRDLFSFDNTHGGWP